MKHLPAVAGFDDFDALIAAWADATVEEVLAAVSSNEYVSIVFIADRGTMVADHHALPAVTTLSSGGR